MLCLTDGFDPASLPGGRNTVCLPIFCPLPLPTCLRAYVPTCPGWVQYQIIPKLTMATHRLRTLRSARLGRGSGNSHHLLLHHATGRVAELVGEYSVQQYGGWEGHAVEGITPRGIFWTVDMALT